MTETTQTTAGPAVYRSICAVQAELARIGIAKERKNVQQGYAFRGIDDVYGALAPLLAKHRLCILPRMVSRTSTERATPRGGVLFYVTVEAEFDFVSAEDGSRHTVKTFGEAMDSGDKATNKAMSAAYKYAAFQAFSIPTEGDNDADAQPHEVAARPDIATILYGMSHAPSMEILKGHFTAAWQTLDEPDKTQAKAAYDKRKAELSSESLPPYPADSFAANLPKWQAAMQAGKTTATDVIATVQSRFTLSGEQIAAIQQAAQLATPAATQAQPA